mgnify:CR=1 FL=1
MVVRQRGRIVTSKVASAGTDDTNRIADIFDRIGYIFELTFRSGPVGDVAIRVRIPCRIIETGKVAARFGLNDCAVGFCSIDGLIAEGDAAARRNLAFRAIDDDLIGIAAGRNRSSIAVNVYLFSSIGFIT